MGCIEISEVLADFYAAQKFNRNMGCIEIDICAWKFHQFLGLIETWDVLK